MSTTETPSEKRTENVHADVTPELKHELRLEAAREGKSQSQLVREVLADFLDVDESAI